MKQEAEQFRQWKASREKELLQVIDCAGHSNSIFLSLSMWHARFLLNAVFEIFICFTTHQIMESVIAYCIEMITVRYKTHKLSPNKLTFGGHEIVVVYRHQVVGTWEFDPMQPHFDLNFRPM